MANNKLGTVTVSDSLKEKLGKFKELEGSRAYDAKLAAADKAYLGVLEKAIDGDEEILASVVRQAESTPKPRKEKGAKSLQAIA